MKHQICLAVYGGDDEFLPTAQEFNELWRKFKVFGSHKTKAVVYDASSPPSSKNCEITVRLGEDRPWRGEISPDVRIEGGFDIYPSGTEGARIFEHTDLSLLFGDRGYQRGLSTAPRLTFAVSEQFFDDIGETAYFTLLSQLLGFASLHGAFYGLVTVDFASRILAGNGFCSANHPSLPLDCKLQHAMWVKHGYPDRMARSVFWGNFFDRLMLDRLGGKSRVQSFVDSKLNSPTDTEEPLHQEFHDGLFVKLSHSPFDWQRNPKDRYFISDNAIKLQAFLMENGLL